MLYACQEIALTPGVLSCLSQIKVEPASLQLWPPTLGLPLNKFSTNHPESVGGRALVSPQYEISVLSSFQW